MSSNESGIGRGSGGGGRGRGRGGGRGRQSGRGGERRGGGGGSKPNKALLTVAAHDAPTAIAIEEKLPAAPSSSAGSSPSKKPQSPDREGRPPRPPDHKNRSLLKRDNHKDSPSGSNTSPHKKMSATGIIIDKPPRGGNAFSWDLHPARDSPEFTVNYTATVLLSVYPEKAWKKVYPSHPDRPLCVKFSRGGGVCDFGNSCKFDHPAKGRSTDEAMVDAALATLDKPLHEAYELAFAIIRAVDSFDELESCITVPDRGVAVKELFQYSIEKLHTTCLELLNRQWTLAASSSSYGLEVTLLYSVVPRCAERARTFIYRVYLDTLLVCDIDRTFSSIRLALLDREKMVLNTMRSSVPLPPTTCSPGGQTGEDSAAAAALGLHCSMMSHSNSCTAAMCQTAGIRDAVIEEMRAALVPVIYEEVEDFLIASFPKFAGPKAEEGNSFHVDCKLLPFGSSANTVGTLSSDLDIILDVDIKLHTDIGDGEIRLTKFNQHETERMKVFTKKYLSFVLDAFNLDDESMAANAAKATTDESGPFILREFISSARVPVLKLQHKASGIDIDLIEGSTNRMGLLNTQLLRDYASADPRVRPLMLAVKRWASARCVSVSSNGTLSTYCWMLMVVFFLQVTVTEKDPDSASPALKLKQLCGTDYTDSRLKETYKLREQSSLTRIYTGIQEQTHDSPGPTPENEDLGRLLVRFFAFYGTEAEDSFRTFENIAVLRENIKQRKIGANSAEKDRNWQRARARSASLTDEAISRSRAESNATEDMAGKTTGMVTPTKGAASSAEDTESDGLDGIALDIEAKMSLQEEVIALKKATGGERLKELMDQDVVSFTPDTKSKKKNVIDSGVIWRICIEDPFEDEHDLGSVVRSQIGQSYILTELRRAVSLLHDYLIAKTMQGEDVFQVLCTVNENPPDLSYPCHICHSMDHKVKDCLRFVCFKCGKHGHFTSQCEGEKKKKLVGSQNKANKARKRKEKSDQK